MALLNDEDENVLTNVVGALSQCCRSQNNRESVRTGNGLRPMVDLLNWTYAPLLENLSRCLAECAKDPDSMTILEQLDAVRLIWSLLKNKHPRVQAYAAFALCPYVKNAFESGELVRSLVGAMELVVELLHSKDTLVLAAVCAAIAEIAKDKVNLAILSDHKVINMLADLGNVDNIILLNIFNLGIFFLLCASFLLVHTKDDLLREYLAAAIASCAPHGTNTQQLGNLRTVTPIVGYMVSTNPNVHRTTAMALQELSADPQNCITMHQV